MAITNAAPSILRPSDRLSGRSNSSGPWTVKLYGGPPSVCVSRATAAELVPKWACKCWAPQEAVADVRVLVDEVGHFHEAAPAGGVGACLYSMSVLRRASRRWRW